MSYNHSMKTKGELESEISQIIVRFEKDHLGRGPLETRAYLIDDMVLVRLKKVLIPAEIKLAESSTPDRGRDLIKQLRQELIERGRPILEAELKVLLGVDMISLHTDISTRTGERIMVFTFDGKIAYRTVGSSE
ncbi:MAG: DUF2294 domain-containing protein [Gemmatales bacterium]